MTVVSTDKDVEALTLTITADFPAPPSSVWQVWEDPRKLERWWGPPTWPATFTEHSLVAGGRSHYFMTGPDGERAHGWWVVLHVDAPRQFEFEDGFSDQSGTPNTSMPTTYGRVELVEIDGGTRMTIHSRFPSAEAMEQLVAMGMVEGMTLAMGQIDDILAAA